jgi:transposase
MDGNQEKTLSIVIKVMEEKLGIRLVKQVFTILLMLFGIDKKIITKSLGVSKVTMRKYDEMIQTGTVSELFKDNVYKQRSELENYREQIMAELDKNPATTLREAAVIIEKLTGIKRSIPRVRNFLKKNGYRPLKVGFLPAKADITKQKEFIKDTLKPMIKLAKEGKIQLFFVDASHFVMGGFVGQVWSKVRLFVKTSSGRSRYNVLGALNFATKKLETITNDSYITSDQVIMLIDKLIENCKDQVIKLVLDNVKYQRCKKVMEYAISKGVELIFLPTYSPNLNLIERLWKFVKSEVLNAAYYGSFDDFKNAINNCIDELDKTHIKRINSLITENIQEFNDITILQKVA